MYRSCSLDDCEARHKAKGFCSKHYARFKKNNTPHLKQNKGTLTKKGYIQVSHNKKLKFQHRIIMESFLGRELHEFETVHHKNGIKSDNHIDNLELWTKPQPTGQRVEDLVDWVIETYPEIIERKLNV